MSRTRGEVNSKELLSSGGELLGFPEGLVERPDFPRHLALAVASTFSEGEITYNHPPFESDSDALCKQFGKRRYIDGEFGAQLQGQLEADDQSKKIAASLFVGFGARIFAQKVSDDAMVLPTRPAVTVYKNERRLGFHDYMHGLQFDPQVVIDYGPGLAGRFHIDQQLADLRQCGTTYQYYGLARGIFVPEFLRHYLRLKGHQYPRAVDAIRQKNLHVILDQGIEGSVQHLIPSPDAKGRNGEFADIVIASGIHSAGEAALNGIKQARGLLKRNGVLLVRDVNEPSEEDPGVSMNEMIQAGLDGGFRSGRMRSYDLTMSSPQGGAHEGRAIIMQK